MMFKNTTKLVSANFVSFWKMLIYKFFVLAIGFGLLCCVSAPLLEAFASVGFGTAITNFLGSYSVLGNIVQVIQSLSNLIVIFLNGILALFSFDLFAGIFATIVILFVIPFLDNLAQIAFGECMYGYMASLSRFSFMSSYIRKLGKSIIFSFLKTLIGLCLTVPIVAGCYYVFQLINIASYMIYIAPILFIVVFVLLLALKQTFLSGWMPAIVVYNDGAVKGFAQGLRAVGRRFFKTLSNLIVINAIFLVLIYLLSIYSLIFVYPLFNLFMITFQMVMFFGSNGMRYYVDMDTILTPQKLETFDKYKKVINLI